MMIIICLNGTKIAGCQGYAPKFQGGFFATKITGLRP